MRFGRRMGAGLLLTMAALPAHGWCVRIGLHNAAMLMPLELTTAERTATQIFAGIGVPVEWTAQDGRSSGCELVEVEFTFDADAKQAPEVLAWSFPYRASGIRVYVLPERLPHFSKILTVQGRELGHVLAHEVGHVLEGISRHSTSGLMKEHWTRGDFSVMKEGVLPFTPDDAYLIRMGLQLAEARGKPGGKLYADLRADTH